MHSMALLLFALASFAFTIDDTLSYQGAARLVDSTCKPHYRIITSNSGVYNHLPLAASKNIIEREGAPAPESSLPSRVEERRQQQPTSAPVKFDISLAVILAGYSFEAYNEPVSHTLYYLGEDCNSRCELLERIAMMIIQHLFPSTIKRLSDRVTNSQTC